MVGFADGGFGGLRAMDVTDLAMVPDGVDLGEAATLPVAAGTALRALEQAGPLLGRSVRRGVRFGGDGAVQGGDGEGRTFEVLIDLTLDAQDAETVERFEETLARAEEVLELRRLFGSPDYFVRVAVADLAAYEAFLSQRVMTIPRIKNVTSHFTMKNVKPVPERAPMGSSRTPR
ncbi:Lrp/AsnC ligand binding domain-containing protein [Streptomyces sp. NPDC001530]|uniref:Lrp/AsnC ligand binding domain-containing protein n=1 Tax=Streptomyces sp. NPDC001530 TaxID=3364582 RepID=UPI003698EFF0